MISTVTLNPCLDKTVSLEQFNYGQLNRIKDMRLDPSGKGINVAIALTQLEKKAICLGINYRENGNLISDYLDQLNIFHDFVKVQGAVRTNLKVLDLKNNIITEINEKGQAVSKQDIDNLLLKINKYASQSEIVILSGSIPKGVSPNIYKKIIMEINKYPCKVILDAEGEMLTQGIKAQPYLIKPNLYELELSYQRKFNSKKEIITQAQGIIAKGIKVVCVSLGEKGALIVNEKEAYYAPPLALDVKGVAGAGDSLVAGICIALLKNMSLAEMLQSGVAAASASLIREGTLLCKKEDYKRLLAQVQLEKLS